MIHPPCRFPLEALGRREGPVCDLGALPERLYSSGTSFAKPDAHWPYLLRLRPKEITPENAWLRARPRVSAPEMSTIVRAGEEWRGTWTGPAGELGGGKLGVQVRLETSVPSGVWGCPVSPHPHPRIASWGRGHTPYSSPPRRLPLIVASSESRSKLTFCTLHYAPPRVPRGRGPAPAPRRQLDWAINLRAPHTPRPAPGFCAPDRGPRALAGPSGLLTLIRRPAPPGPRLCQGAARPGRRAAVSHPSARPRPSGSVHLFELTILQRLGWGRGLSVGQGASTPSNPAPHV